MAAPFPVFAAGANSIVIRLIGPFEFVDRRENSVDPLSNEFDSQEVEIASYHTQPLMAVSWQKTRFSLYWAARVLRRGASAPLCPEQLVGDGQHMRGVARTRIASWPQALFAP